METRKELLILGATGFIGRNLLEYYYKQDKYNITVTWHSKFPMWIAEYPNVKLVEANLLNQNDVNDVVEGKNIVLQFAATTSGAKDIVNKPYIHVTDNAVMNSLLLRACYEFDVEHFVFPSCTVMYQPSDKALKERDWNGGDEIFPTYFGVGNTKVYIEKMCEFYSRLGKTKHTVIRHSNIYGPYDKYDYEHSHMFGANLRKVMDEEKEITIWGTGEESRDLLYVEDLVEFVDNAIEIQEEPYELFNVGLGKATKVINVVKELIKQSGKDLKIVHDLSQPTIPTSLFLDCWYALFVLGWKPKTSLEEGIAKTMEWYKQSKFKW